MANSSGIHHQDGKNVSSSSNGADPIGGNSVLESSRTALKHNPGISTNWSLDEQAILDAALLKRRPSDSAITFYAKIATELPNKTVRDVALRCRWMTVEKKENSKRRKDENLARKGKDKKERVSDPKTSQFTASPFVPPYATPMMSTDSDEGIPSKAISGVARELLEQNGKVMKQISANLSIMQLHENLVLLAETRDNILKLMNDTDPSANLLYLSGVTCFLKLNDSPELMKQMPLLPVMINEELANTILPPSSLRYK